jgi:hypothetical protein
MPDEDEFAARSQLKWQPDGDAWILLYRRKRMGRVVPDTDFPGTWRSHGQPELNQGRRAGPGRERGCLQACKHPLKTPAKQGVSESNFVAHEFKCGGC